MSGDRPSPAQSASVTTTTTGRGPAWRIYGFAGPRRPVQRALYGLPSQLVASGAYLLAACGERNEQIRFVRREAGTDQAAVQAWNEPGAAAAPNRLFANMIAGQVREADSVDDAVRAALALSGSAPVEVALAPGTCRAAFGLPVDAVAGPVIAVRLLVLPSFGA